MQEPRKIRSRRTYPTPEMHSLTLQRLNRILGVMYVGQCEQAGGAKQECLMSAGEPAKGRVVYDRFSKCFLNLAIRSA